jgi:hypothetical protein
MRVQQVKRSIGLEQDLSNGLGAWSAPILLGLSMRSLFLASVFCLPWIACAADESSFLHPTPSILERPNALLVFAGRLSTTDMASTMVFDLNYTPRQNKPSYDNDIVGAAYERDLFELGRDLRLRVEGGLAERFGHFLLC